MPGVFEDEGRRNRPISENPAQGRFGFPRPLYCARSTRRWPCLRKRALVAKKFDFADFAR